MQKNINMKDFPGLVLLPERDSKLPALPSPKIPMNLPKPQSYYKPYHRLRDTTKTAKMVYNLWQQKLKNYLNIPKPGVITCIRSRDKAFSLIPFIKNEIYMQADTIMFDWMNVQGICHPMAQMVSEDMMPHTIFIDMTFIDDISPPLYKTLKFLLDGITPPTQKYPYSTLFEFQHIVLFGDRFPCQVGHFPPEAWQFLDLDRGELFVTSMDQAIHEIHEFYNIGYKCQCLGCTNTRQMDLLMKELVESVPLTEPILPLIEHLPSPDPAITEFPLSKSN